MNLERAIRRASGVPGRKTGARLYNEIEYELALGEPDEHLEEAGERALALLEGRFPGVREAAREIEQPPSLSRRASDALQTIGLTTPRSRPPTRRRTRPRRASRWSWRRLYEEGLAHPLLALAVVALCIVVIVHFFAYVVLGAIALSAIKAWEGRRRSLVRDRQGKRSTPCARLAAQPGRDDRHMAASHRSCPRPR